ncbi:MAG TPA: aminodeoxychorismate/anthranilate synthase component II [Parachlamydiales bacterium]|nr:aminodeoxychorismate/anthranilate synthase component II [Parachlamydiales bacterium]
MLLIIDNYDSFTYNLYQAIAVYDSEVKVVRNDELTVEEIRLLQPKAIVISPGPGRPQAAGVCIEVIEKLGPNIPIFGVCLGHQAIGAAFGAEIVQSPGTMHGKQSLIFHHRRELFKGMPLPFKAGRYHSLVVQQLPDELVVDAEDPEGLIMAMHHRDYPIYGVQFHPESILTPEGMKIIENFLEMCP